MEYIQERMHPYEGNIIWKFPRKWFFCILIFYSFLTIIHHLYMIKHRNVTGFLYNTNIQNHRRAIVNKACFQNNLNSPTHFTSASRSLFVEHYHKLIYCEVPKVGCSNWKRVLILLKLSSIHNPEDLKHNEVHDNKILYRLGDYSNQQIKEILNNYTKVMFSRHPFHRLVSAYRDKILHPQTYYKHIVKSIKFKIRGTRNLESNVTFEEFVRFILHEDPRKMDIHWRPMHHLCDPCNIQYNIYGKIETMELDADYILRSIKAPHHLKYPSIKEYPNESRTDEIISKKYFKSLSKIQLQGLAEIYHLDFVIFGYKNIYDIY